MERLSAVLLFTRSYSSGQFLNLAAFVHFCDALPRTIPRGFDVLRDQNEDLLHYRAILRLLKKNLENRTKAFLLSKIRVLEGL